MAETYLNLLNTAAQVSANVYQQIDQSMTQRMNIQAQAGRFEVETMAKAAQFAEQQRVNDEQIINMRADNYFQAQKLEAEKLLIPVKMQTANLQLEAARLDLQRKKEIEGKNHFNSLTSIYDDQIGYALLETESSGMAQEYLGFKAQVSDYVSKGGKFDSKKFEEGLAIIRSKYKDVKPTSVQEIEYDPQKQYLLDQVSPKLGATYAQRHPAVQGSRNSVAVSYYSSESAKDAGEFAKYNRLYNPEELGQLAVGRNTVLRNKKIIETDGKQADYVRNQLAVAAATPGIEEKSLAQLKSNLTMYENNVSKAITENEELFNNAALGKFGPQKKLPEIKEDKKEVTTYTEKPAQPQGESFGLKSTQTPDIDRLQQQKFEGVEKTYHAVSGLVKNKEGQMVPAVPREQTEFADVDLSWYNKSETGEEPDFATKSEIRERVETGVKRLANGKSYNTVATKDKMDKLFGTLRKQTTIPVSSWLADTLAKSKVRLTMFSSDGPDGGTPVITFGPKKEGILSYLPEEGPSVQNAEQIIEAINKIPKKEEREEALKEMYGALSSASFSTGLTDKAK